MPSVPQSTKVPALQLKTRQVYNLFQDLWNKSLGFFLKGLSAKMCSKMFKKLMAPKLYKVRHLRHRQTCFQFQKNSLKECFVFLGKFHREVNETSPMSLHVFIWGPLKTKAYTDTLSPFSQQLQSLENKTTIKLCQCVLLIYSQ